MIVGGVRPPQKAQDVAERGVAVSPYPGAVSPSASEDWKRFSADLALCLSDLQEDEYLILSAKRANFFVQFAGQGRFGMRVEATSNSYIEEPEAQLTTDDYARLTQLGWHLPTRPPHEPGQPEPPDPDGSPNFFIDPSYPVDFQRLVRLAVDTLRQVYHVAHPGQLQYKAFVSHGPVIRFPTLRLKREGV